MPCRWFLIFGDVLAPPPSRDSQAARGREPDGIRAASPGKSRSFPEVQRTRWPVAAILAANASRRLPSAILAGIAAATFPAVLARGSCPLGEPEPVFQRTERVTHKTRCLRKRPYFPGVLTFYSLAALRERILFIFPSE